MRDEILTYLEMCSREGLSLQRGMNFRAPPGTSILLMSRRPGAPYRDEITGDGQRLLYEGHDARKAPGIDPNKVDQPWTEGRGYSTDNAKFAGAATPVDPPLVRVYEKLRDGIWSDKGLFKLVGYKYEMDPEQSRNVFKFQLDLTDIEEPPRNPEAPLLHARIIPSAVKQEVFKRDGGRCVICGQTDQLHFDHDLPFSKGGTSLTAQNVRIFCARHNLSKGARIE